jgi:hypothetical protein
MLTPATQVPARNPVSSTGHSIARESSADALGGADDPLGPTPTTDFADRRIKR